jgi:glucose-1-phosphate adenylyltransferase
MPNVRVGENTVIENAIIAENTVIGDNCYIGFSSLNDEEPKLPIASSDITVIGENMIIPTGFQLNKGSMIDTDNYKAFQRAVV